jgi:hypothetical protein
LRRFVPTRDIGLGYSITSSARASNIAGISRPRAFAAQSLDEPAGLTPERLPTEVQAG